MEPYIPGKELCRLRPPKVTEHQGCMKCLAVAPGGTLVTGGRDNAIICWDIRVRQPAVLNVVKYSHKPLAKRSAASLSGAGPTKASVTALDFIDDQVWPLNQFAPFSKKSIDLPRGKINNPSSGRGNSSLFHFPEAAGENIFPFKLIIIREKFL